ncbi:hypothetical protein ALO_16891 [Acetonema longum DSM 6540]|uniref:Uncharacterized protein n=1 Tax=Acetonema longum DSM 6540 TaxID=1009370 RepID=F7NMP7_9FIRM|nr:hypothetical protein ALO_16891 [Acetonema longum DSM 6540]
MGWGRSTAFALPDRGYRIGTAIARANAPVFAGEMLNLSAAEVGMGNPQ